MNKLSVYLDAGFKDGISTHNWLLFDGKGKRIKRRSFKANEEDSNKAELQTINHLLQYLYKKNIGDVTIHTDSMYCVRLLTDKRNFDGESATIKTGKLDTDYLKFLMKGFNIDIQWVSRETKLIKLADFYCGQLMETVFKRKEYTYQPLA